MPVSNEQAGHALIAEPVNDPAEASSPDRRILQFDRSPDGSSVVLGRAPIEARQRPPKPIAPITQGRT
jgi:hypothetical protein